MFYDMRRSGDFSAKLKLYQAFLRRAESRTGWSLTRIARESGVSQSLVLPAVNNPDILKSLPKRETIHRIERATGELYQPEPESVLEESVAAVLRCLKASGVNSLEPEEVARMARAVYKTMILEENADPEIAARILIRETVEK